jgi:ABC-type multidrug transport system ATPase subunit
MAIAAENVSKRFEDFVALDQLSISVPEGSLSA